MNLIVAVGGKWGISKNGGLLAHLPEDMRCFGETTRGRAMVMGRRILESSPGGKPLKNRVNMVLSRDGACTPEDIRVYHSMEDMLEALRDRRKEDVFVIGGCMIYREFLPHYSRARMACIRRAFDVDMASENLDQDENWRPESVNGGKEHEGISFEFRVYRRVRWGDIESLRDSG